MDRFCLRLSFVGERLLVASIKGEFAVFAAKFVVLCYTKGDVTFSYGVILIIN